MINKYTKTQFFDPLTNQKLRLSKANCFFA